MQHVLLFGHQYLAAAFRARGWMVTTVAYRASADIVVERFPIDAFQVLRQANRRKPVDLALFCDESQLPPWSRVGELPVPTVWYAVDTHIHGVWHQEWQALYDVVLVAQKSKLPTYEARRTHGPVRWCPLFGDHQRLRPPARQRSSEVVFVGNLNAAVNPDRVAFFQALQRLTTVSVRQGDYAELYGECSIGLNQSLDGELNFRNFEVLASGSALLTEVDLDGMADCLHEGRHFLAYERGNAEDCARVIETMLAEPARVEALRFRGYEEVLSNHLDIHRVDQIETWLESWDLAGLVNARFQAPESWRDSNARVFEYASKVYQSHGRDREAGIYRSMAAEVWR